MRITSRTPTSSYRARRFIYRRAKPSFRLAATAAACALFAFASSSCVAADVHGWSPEDWREAFVSGAELPLERLESPNAAAIKRLGPGAFLFLSMHAEDRGLLVLREELLRLAVRHEAGRPRERAAELLTRLLEREGRRDELLRFLESKDGEALPLVRRAGLLAEQYAAAGRPADALARLEAERSLLGPAAAADPAFLARAVAIGAAAASPSWRADFSSLFGLDSQDGGVAAGMARALKAVDQAPEAVVAGLDAAALLLARARSASAARDYGASVRAFRAYARSGSPGAELDPAAVRLTPEELAALLAGLPRPAASDAARAFIFGSRAEGEAGWALIAARARAGLLGDAEAFHGLFWHGRFARAAERWAEAAGAFAQAAAYASAGADRDAAHWYRVECLSKISQRDAASALAEALALSAAPAYYSDLVEPLSRRALASRDGQTLAALAAAVGARGAGRDAARMAYISARAAEAGVIAPAHRGGLSQEDYARQGYQAAYRQSHDPWYRLLAAYRLGLPLADPADGPGAPEPQARAGEAGAPGASVEPPADPASARPAPTEAPAAIVEADDDDYALGLVAFGLARRVRSEFGTAFRRLGADTLRAAAESMAARDDAAEAIRLIAPLFSRNGLRPTRRDKELYWPRPYREAVEANASLRSLSPALLYGLVRSESLFQPAVVSSAGAIGLSQLMPATADEMAGRLRMPSYDARDPDDNLFIGAAYLRRLLDSVGGRILPALYAYNAGLTRFRRWEAAAPRFPADLFLETLDFSETRQYGRNVVGAAAAYAELYYEEGEAGVRAFLATMLEEAN